MSRTVRDVLREGARRLFEAGLETPNGDARRLMARAAGFAPDRLTLHLAEPLSRAHEDAFHALISQRMARRPVSQIVGGRWFYGHWFRVTDDVLDPRPETEALVALALQGGFERVLDLGTGSGCILLSLLAERPEATGLGTDISEAALGVARENASDLGLDGRAAFAVADWFAGVEGRYDLVVSNPPYIARDEMADLAPEVRDHEPRRALTDEGDGLSAYRVIARDVGDIIAPGGRLLVEIGAGQGTEVAVIFDDAGLEEVTVHSDLDGRDRVVSARAPGP